MARSTATYNQTAAAFNNPDYVSIVIGNYRWRQSLYPAQPEYASIEAELQQSPRSMCPPSPSTAITIDGHHHRRPSPSTAITIDGKYDPFAPPGTSPRSCFACSGCGSS